jgi:hypothetical protein
MPVVLRGPLQLEASLCVAVDTIKELTPLCQDRWCLNDVLDDDDSNSLKKQVASRPSLFSFLSTCATASKAAMRCYRCCRGSPILSSCPSRPVPSSHSSVAPAQVVDALTALVTPCIKVVSATASNAQGDLPRHPIPGMDPCLLTSKLPPGGWCKHQLGVGGD